MKTCFVAALFVLFNLGRPAFSQGVLTLNEKRLAGLIETLKPLHKKIEASGPYDWLSQHYEPGQTFREYIRSDPIRPKGRRRRIYIQPIGEFSNTQVKIIRFTADFLRHFFNLPVSISKKIPLSAIPKSARRVHPQWGDRQILTTYVLDKILIRSLPKDAACMIAFTTSDLWPGEGWNFVFGQASIDDRVGVWSIYRNGLPDKSEKNFQLCLLRTIKTAAHETGHMFSLLHCIKYQCLMAGSNHRKEADRRPLALCPECLAKVLWIKDADTYSRYKQLAHFCRTNSLIPEAEFYQESLATVNKSNKTKIIGELR